MISDLKDVSCIHVVNNLDFGGGGVCDFLCLPKKQHLVVIVQRLRNKQTKSTLFFYIYCIYQKVLIIGCTDR